jgi:hypothetical protein
MLTKVGISFMMYGNTALVLIGVKLGKAPAGEISEAKKKLHNVFLPAG